MLLSVQIVSALLLFIVLSKAEAPPGYVKPAEIPEKNPPKYEYGYNIEDEKGTAHGKLEARDGIYALGRYYVQGTDSTHNVQYYADDWGYHPYIEYSNVGPHSKSRTQLLLGVEAVKALASNKFTSNSVPPKQHITETISSKINSKNQQVEQSQQQSQIQQNIVQEQTHQVVVQQQQQQQQPQQVVVHQPQVIVQQQPQQVLIPRQVLLNQDRQQLIVQQQEIQQPHQLVVQQVQQPILVQQQQLQQVLLQQEPQLVQIQQQQHQEQQQQVEQSQTQDDSVVIENNQIQENLLVNQQFERKTINTQSQQNEYDEASLTRANLGGFGSRINLLGRNRQNYQNNAQLQRNSNKLIETTKNLVSGQDVLNINSAVDEKVETTIESSTVKPSVTEYSNGQVSQNLIEANSQQVTETSLIQQPIVVADLDEKVVSSTENYAALKQEAKEETYSTTANTVETVSTKSYGITEPSTIIVTPRPVSTTFLAPINAGVQLQSVENSQNLADSIQKQNYVVEIQKSLPYYLGKFEYVQNPSAVGISEQTISTKQTETISTQNHQEKAVENIELGKTLLALPGSQSKEQTEEKSSELQIQQLPEQSIKENFVEIDQQQAQGQTQTQVALQVTTPVVVEKIVEKKVPYPVIQTKIIEKPVEVTKYVNNPYPVEVPIHIPIEVRVPVEKRVPVPVTVEKIVEKPVKVTQIVEKPVPQPYPVEKIVEKPVHVPVEVTRYIDRPYPVQVPVAQPVPYPVDRVVEKIVRQPYPVEVRVPVEVKVPVPVEKIVEKKVPVPHYIEKQVPVEKIVEKPVPHYIDRPYPVQVQVPIPVAQAYIFPVPKAYGLTALQLPHLHTTQKFSVATKTVEDYKQQEQVQQEQVQQNVYVHASQYAPTASTYLLQKDNSQNNNGYLPPPPVHNCDQHNSYSSKNLYYTIKPDDYIGLLPPKLQNNDVRKDSRKFRNARSNFNSNNLRLEYGFMPPLIPSQEIDEHGNPIENSKNK